MALTIRVKALSYAGFKAPCDLNHKAHKEHKGKEKLFLVLFVCFVVPIQISQPFTLTRELSAQLQQLARDEQTTLCAVMLSAFALLLSR